MLIASSKLGGGTSILVSHPLQILGTCPPSPDVDAHRCEITKGSVTKFSGSPRLFKEVLELLTERQTDL